MAFVATDVADVAEHVEQLPNWQLEHGDYNYLQPLGPPHTAAVRIVAPSVQRVTGELAAADAPGDSHVL